MSWLAGFSGSTEAELPEVAPSSSSKESDEQKTCEAYVTLGRLHHVRDRHQRDTQRLKDALKERVDDAYREAANRVRGEFESLQKNLEQLYRKSLIDLDTHRSKVQQPTQDCLKVLNEQTSAVRKAEDDLKALLADPDLDRCIRDLPQAMDQANAVLAFSTDLEVMPLPKAAHVSPDALPVGRLHNVVIAPRRSGDRRRKASATPTPSTTPSTNSKVTKNQSMGNADDAADDDDASSNNSKLKNVHVSSGLRWVSFPAEAQFPPGPEVAAAAAAAARKGELLWEKEGCSAQGGTGDDGGGEDCSARDGERRRRKARGRPGEEEDHPSPQQQQQQPSVAGDGAGGGVATEEACGSCACACRRDDVWAAYRTLRMRYRALKETADKQELRGKVEECRRKLQDEFDLKRKETESELQKAQAEVLDLRAVARDAQAECKTRQREAIVMQNQVLKAQRQLEQALRDALEAREEINRRRQHAEVLVARLRVLQGQTSACAGAVGVDGAPPAYTYDAAADNQLDSEMEDDCESRQPSPHKPSRDTDHTTAPQRQSRIRPAAFNDSASRSSYSADQYGGDLSGGGFGVHHGESVGNGKGRGRRQSRDGGSKKDDIEEETRELERQREHLSREVRRLTSQLSFSSVSTSQDAGNSSSDTSRTKASNLSSSRGTSNRGRDPLARSTSHMRHHHGVEKNGGETRRQYRRSNSASSLSSSSSPSSRRGGDGGGGGYRFRDSNASYFGPDLGRKYSCPGSPDPSTATATARNAANFEGAADTAAGHCPMTASGGHAIGRHYQRRNYQQQQRQQRQAHSPLHGGREYNRGHVRRATAGDVSSNSSRILRNDNVTAAPVGTLSRGTGRLKKYTSFLSKSVGVSPYTKRESIDKEGDGEPSDARNKAGRGAAAGGSGGGAATAWPWREKSSTNVGRAANADSGGDHSISSGVRGALGRTSGKARIPVLLRRVSTAI